MLRPVFARRSNPRDGSVSHVQITLLKVTSQRHPQTPALPYMDPKMARGKPDETDAFTGTCSRSWPSDGPPADSRANAGVPLSPGWTRKSCLGSGQA